MIRDKDGKQWRDEAEREYFRQRAPVAPKVTKEGGSLGGTVETHPAFGMIHASRVSGRTNLFGSDFPHREHIAITINRAVMNRTLSKDWPFGREEVCRVLVSEAQWATMISTLNYGSGVPCTFDHIQHEIIPQIALVTNRREQFKAEASEDIVEAEQNIDKALAMIKSGKLRKGELESLLTIAKNHLTGGINFVAKSFNEHVETTVEHAKVEVEAYLQSTISRAGLGALGAKPPLELKGDDEP